MMRKFLFISALVVLWIGYHAVNYQPSDRATDTAAKATETAFTETQAVQFRRLRDEAIQNIGWVAGNAHGHPIWAEIGPYLTRGGEYYDTLLSMTPPDSNHEVEAMMNVGRYEDWFERGEAVPFNESEATSRLIRVNDIVSELTALIARVDH